MADETNIPPDTENPSSGNELQGEETIHEITAINGLYENWFLDYASYVILERAVPAIEDGLKPVQRRILHSMKDMDDGRFNKVANVIGHTMQYHPHGDAAIGDAMVNLGQKDLMIETQGNWGDMRTGDSAAAPRYIEARLSKFALEVAFNADTTQWQASYDGRRKEPVTLPMKFPLLLAQGVEGIAVGLSTKILPHNFVELINASIEVLRNKPFTLYPDFLTGGSIDISNYNDGFRGGKIRCRARIEEVDKKTLLIKDIPYGTTTTSLIESIVKANDNGKIKIKKVIDNTAADVEIEIQLHPGTSPDITIDALYAFTECEVSISPNACVIVKDSPNFLSVSEILKISAQNTKDLLRQELEIKKNSLEEKWHFSSLEKIFIENRIYRNIEECETWEAVLLAIDKGLKPHKKKLRREVTTEDIIRLTEIKIKRISKFDAFKADEYVKDLEAEMEEVDNHLAHLTDFAIDYYKNLLKKYGKGRERKTEIKTFDTIKANVVAIANQKLYVNYKEGFVGYGLKKDEFISECSDLDDIIIFRKDAKMQVIRIAEKTFVGKDIEYAAVWKKNDERMIYNLIYVDGKSGITRAKRFAVTGITRDKEYDLTLGNKNSRMLHFSANPNSESEVVTVYLSPNSKAHKKIYDYDFADLDIKGRASQGNILSKHTVKKIVFKQKGASTLGGRDIYYDEILGRLNVDERGKYLGSFNLDDLILVVFSDGSYELTSFDLTNRYEAEKILIIEKYYPEKIISALHYDATHQCYYAKRFCIETTTVGKKFVFIDEAKNSSLVFVTTFKNTVLNLTAKSGKDKETLTINVDEFADVRGWKALGSKLNVESIMDVEFTSGEEQIFEPVVAEIEETEAETQPEETPAKEFEELPKEKKKGDQLKLF
ncbi:MAG: DNA gyrase/topoisomerase IV subunit A [Bacteroidetes bacterium]|nr:DNA gyrase/topoisomerase IV subunit A [Bacteroidota bacterium]